MHFNFSKINTLRINTLNCGHFILYVTAYSSHCGALVFIHFGCQTIVFYIEFCFRKYKFHQIGDFHTNVLNANFRWCKQKAYYYRKPTLDFRKIYHCTHFTVSTRDSAVAAVHLVIRTIHLTHESNNFI